MAEQAAKQPPPRWHRYERAADGDWCKHCGGVANADWHRTVRQASDPPTVDSVLSKLVWATGGEWSVPLKPAECALLVPIVQAHLGRPPA